MKIYYRCYKPINYGKELKKERIELYKRCINIFLTEFYDYIWKTVDKKMRRYYTDYNYNFEDVTQGVFKYILEHREILNEYEEVHKNKKGVVKRYSFDKFVTCIIIDRAMQSIIKKVKEEPKVDMSIYRDTSEESDRDAEIIEELESYADEFQNNLSDRDAKIFDTLRLNLTSDVDIDPYVKLTGYTVGSFRVKRSYLKKQFIDFISKKRD